MTTIVGAGLAGLLAAHAFPGAGVVESSPEPFESHKALLRFRSDAVARLTGIDFHPVTVRKGIWFAGQFRDVNLQLANLYAIKTVGQVVDRSIWNQAAEQRWIAPPDLYDRLVSQVQDRIQWGVTHDFTASQDTVVSTTPLPLTLKALGKSVDGFNRNAIRVKRFRLPGADVYQTVYFPTLEHGVYRASITKDLLIVEFAEGVEGPWTADVFEAFGIPAFAEIVPVDTTDQAYGKIVPVDPGWRRAAVARLTIDHGIYSLGRFATWRNILLDDVVDDIKVVKRLMASDEHDRRLTAAN